MIDTADESAEGRVSFVLEQAKDPFGKVFASSFGVGAQWRNILPGWDAGLDLRYVSNAARDRLLASDPPGVRGQR